MTLVPVTIDEIRKIKGYSKYEVQSRYLAWLKQQREEDKKVIRKLYRWAHRRRINKYAKRYYQENKFHIDLMNKMNRIRKQRKAEEDAKIQHDGPGD